MKSSAKYSSGCSPLATLKMSHTIPPRINWRKKILGFYQSLYVGIVGNDESTCTHLRKRSHADVAILL